MTRRMRMNIAGMSCADCEHHVARALEGAGASQVEADFRRGLARFSVAGAVDAAALRSAFETAGYRLLTIRSPGSRLRRGRSRCRPWFDKKTSS